MSDGLRQSASDEFEAWHEENFECHSSAISASDSPRYHADFLKQAFLDAFVLGYEYAEIEAEPEPPFGPEKEKEKTPPNPVFREQTK